jgi:hypothetical protein
MAVGDFFTWGAGGSKLTPEQLALAKAVLAKKRMGGVDTSPVGHWAAGAARIADALGDVVQERRLGQQEADLNAYNAEQSAPIIAALSGNPTTTTGNALPITATTGASQEMAATSPNVSPDIRSGIIETANALGIDPVDLGTAISYETGGTFDPVKSGPTTQWGTHRGLIQFGEPQAKQYGVDWNNPVGSQLGANGAVANYLRATGVKPGMGLMDVYSAINAGGVGRYDRSDAKNGGAPGTVADKVNNQMGGHRVKAIALLGENPAAPVGIAAPIPVERQPLAAADPANAVVNSPSAAEVYSAPSDFAAAYSPTTPAQAAPVQVAQAQMQSIPPAAIAQALRVIADPRANQGTRAVAEALIKRQQAQEQASQEQNTWMARQQYAQQQQASDPLRQLQIQEAQLKIAAAQDPNANVPDAVKSLDLRAQRAGLQPGSPEYNNFFITQGVRPPANIGAPPSGYRYEYDAAGNPTTAVAIPGSPAAMEAEQRQKALGNQQAGRATVTDTVTSAAERARQAVNGPGLPATGVMGNIMSAFPESNAAEVRRQINVLKSNATIENITAMRAQSPTGAALGSVTDREGAILADKVGTLDPGSPNFQRDLDDYERTFLRTVHGKEQGDKIFQETRKAVDPDIKAAKDAIARGAPRDAVIKRLKDAGLDTEGL